MRRARACAAARAAFAAAAAAGPPCRSAARSRERSTARSSSRPPAPSERPRACLLRAEGLGQPEQVTRGRRAHVQLGRSRARSPRRPRRLRRRAWDRAPTSRPAARSPAPPPPEPAESRRAGGAPARADSRYVLPADRHEGRSAGGRERDGGAAIARQLRVCHPRSRQAAGAASAKGPRSAKPTAAAARPRAAALDGHSHRQHTAADVAELVRGLAAGSSSARSPPQPAPPAAAQHGQAPSPPCRSRCRSRAGALLRGRHRLRLRSRSRRGLLWRSSTPAARPPGEPPRRAPPRREAPPRSAPRSPSRLVVLLVVALRPRDEARGRRGWQRRRQLLHERLGAGEDLGGGQTLPLQPAELAHLRIRAISRRPSAVSCTGPLVPSTNW